MIANYDIEARRKAKMRSDDRVLVLGVMRDKKPRDTLGHIDPRLFTGENHLHVIYDDITGMWRFRYDIGGIPETLKQNFTTFTQAVDTAKRYFANRNVEIVKVID